MWSGLSLGMVNEVGEMIRLGVLWGEVQS